MYAIVDIAGQQFKIEQGQEVFVHRLEGEEGSQVTFDDVLLIDADGTISVGKPLVEGAFVSAKILSHDKGDKVLVFKKKRRKGYRKLNGHRDYLTRILIEQIALTGGKKKVVMVTEKAIEPKVEPVVAKVEPVVVKEEPVVAKKKRVVAKKEPVVSPVDIIEIAGEEAAPVKPVRKRAVKKAAPEGEVSS